MKEKHIAVDFDGTVVKWDFPNVGEDVPDAVRVLKRIAEAGHKLILLTMRSPQPDAPHLLSNAVQWFRDREIPLSAVNCNANQHHWSSSRKVYANWYIDDQSIGCPLISQEGKRAYVDWLAVESMLEANGTLVKSLDVAF